MKTFLKTSVAYYFLFLAFISCTQNETFDEPEKLCVNSEVIVNTSFKEVKKLYKDRIIQIQEDLIIEGYIISSDLAGNFFGTLHFQDDFQNPKEGFQINIDLRESHLFYERGSKVIIKLKNLYLGNRNGVFELGGVFTNTGGTLSVGRLPLVQVRSHIFSSCDLIQKIQPFDVLLTEINDSLINTLIKIENIEVAPEDICKSYAISQERTERALRDCDGSEIILNNSGFSDFQDSMLPSGSGELVGVLGKSGDEYQLTIRDTSDVIFIEERCGGFVFSCETPLIEAKTERLFFSEIADPNNNAQVRFIEIYNANDIPINLDGWEIKRYTNENTTISSSADLSGFILQAHTTFVIAVNAIEFEKVFGFSPDMEGTSGGPAGSNGDDNFELIDANGNVIDVFGIIGEDGSGTNHEFEDGRANRKITITKATTKYTFSEWTIYNDTGGEGTFNEPQDAPGIFTPGKR